MSNGGPENGRSLYFWKPIGRHLKLCYEAIFLKLFTWSYFQKLWFRKKFCLSLKNICWKFIRQNVTIVTEIFFGLPMPKLFRESVSRTREVDVSLRYFCIKYGVAPYYTISYGYFLLNMATKFYPLSLRPSLALAFVSVPQASESFSNWSISDPSESAALAACPMATFDNETGP